MSSCASTTKVSPIEAQEHLSEPDSSCMVKSLPAAQQLKTGTTATAQPNCNGQTLSNMLLPLPPAKEQYRIVEKINRAFAKVK